MNIKYKIKKLVIIIDIDGVIYSGIKTNELINALNMHNIKYILATCKLIRQETKAFDFKNLSPIDTKTIRHPFFNINS
jgi:ribonucleotide monophosphatase NagD (HAD superfamily)